MKYTTILNHNARIAQFMGGKLVTERGQKGIIFDEEDIIVWDLPHLEYERYWEKLMPVIVKLESLGITITIVGKICHTDSEEPSLCRAFIGKSKQDAVYKCAVYLVKMSQRCGRWK